MIFNGLMIFFQFRQLLGADGVRRRSGQLRSLGHGRSGGLRPAPAFVLPPDRRFPHLLLRRVAVVVRQRLLKVGSGNQTSLRRHTCSVNR